MLEAVHIRLSSYPPAQPTADQGPEVRQQPLCTCEAGMCPEEKKKPTRLERPEETLLLGSGLIVGLEAVQKQLLM
jgi:hypothetical protein